MFLFFVGSISDRNNNKKMMTKALNKFKIVAIRKIKMVVLKNFSFRNKRVPNNKRQIDNPNSFKVPEE